MSLFWTALAAGSVAAIVMGVGVNLVAFFVERRAPHRATVVEYGAASGVLELYPGGLSAAQAAAAATLLVALTVPPSAIRLESMSGHHCACADNIVTKIV